MTAAVTGRAPQLAFNHVGICVENLPRMEEFYTNVLGFTVTDRGIGARGMELTFLSRSSDIHHQIVLTTGRPPNLPPNTINPQFGAVINQLSFHVPKLPELRYILERLQAGGASRFFTANHGIAWSVYAHDPEGNNLEFFVETEWYITQPFMIPLDFDLPDEAIHELTESLCKDSAGFQPLAAWREELARRIAPEGALAG
jgi:catechol 2,3-dioxygenase